MSRVVELRYFAELTVQETAKAIDRAVRTVNRLLGRRTGRAAA